MSHVYERKKKIYVSEFEWLKKRGCERSELPSYGYFEQIRIFRNFNIFFSMSFNYERSIQGLVSLRNVTNKMSGKSKEQSKDLSYNSVLGCVWGVC